MLQGSCRELSTDQRVLSMPSAKTQPRPMQEFAACHSLGEGVEATVDYLVPGSRINRRYVAPGAELNTGRYAPHPIFIRNGRLAQSALGLDTQGFVLAKRPSLVFRHKKSAAPRKSVGRRSLAGG